MPPNDERRAPLSGGAPRLLRRGTTFSMEPKPDPWTPLILSLDGGGVRGLSSLFILQRVMQAVRQLLDYDPDNNPITKAFAPSRTISSHVGSEGSSSTTSDGKSVRGGSQTTASVASVTREPDILPCYFFDYMVGTSTGGLIAVMLGRLRMNIEECIAEYWKLSNYVFRPRRHIRNYEAKKLETAIHRVVSQYCGCRGPGTECHGDTERFRQYDYAEQQDPEYDTRGNWTCKVAVVSQRKGDADNELYLWRTYSHHRRYPETFLRERNPRSLASSKVKIWEACRATTAAPLHFDTIKINGQEHMDGGVGNNNPSNIAWLEASYMGKRTVPGTPSDSVSNEDGDVALLLSVGTGKTRSESRFGGFGVQLLSWARWQITETTSAHLSTYDAARRAKSAYYRLSVPPVDGVDGHAGLADIRLSECHKRRRRRWPWGTREQKGKEQGLVDKSDDELTWYRNLQTQATEEHKGGYKPRKYVYSTFEKLFQRTQEYCDAGKCEDRNQTVEDAIKECAAWLVDYARRREAKDPERWRRFISHPNPNHSKYLQPRQETPEE